MKKYSSILHNLDQSGKYSEADVLFNTLLKLAAKNEKSMSDKIIDLLEKEGLKCPECGGNMEFESDEDNYGLCNCGDDDCDCTIDLKEEVDDFLERLNIGEVECPDCQGKMEMKGMHCVCINGKCSCKKHAKDMVLNNLFDGVDFQELAGVRKACKKEDHEYQMARKQLMAAKDSIGEILDAMGDKEEGDLMAWGQSYLTMASDYLQSVENYMEYGSANLEDDDDGIDSHMSHNHDDDDVQTMAYEEAEEMPHAFVDDTDNVRSIEEIMSGPNREHILQEGYEWAADVMSQPGKIVSTNQLKKDMSENELIRFIKNNYDGGISSFVMSTEYAHNDRLASKNDGKRLNKPFRTPGGPKKFSVYVKNKKGNVVKVSFGDPGLSIKRDDPNRRRNFRARHRCDSDPRAKDRTTAKYWSCKFWSSPSVSSLLKG